MKIPNYIEEMDDKEFLEALDDFGDGHHYIHEAAKRIRRLKEIVRHPSNKSTHTGRYCADCGELIGPNDGFSCPKCGGCL